MKTIWRCPVLAVTLLLLTDAAALAQSPRGVRAMPSIAATLPPIGLQPKRLPSFRQPTIAERTQDRRALRQRLDGSSVRPTVRSAVPTDEAAARARFGQPGLDPARAGAFARSGPTAIGQSSVTRPSTGGRRIPRTP